MQRGKDIAARFPGLFLVHHNVPSGDVSEHAHPEHHLIIPLQGEVRLVLASQELVCGPGRMVYVPPATGHIFRSGKDKGERLICMIEPKAWDSVDAHLPRLFLGLHDRLRRVRPCSFQVTSWDNSKLPRKC